MKDDTRRSFLKENGLFSLVFPRMGTAREIKGGAPLFPVPVPGYHDAMETPRLTALLNHLLTLPAEDQIAAARKAAAPLGELMVDSPDHLVLGLACMCNRVGVVRKILTRRPELLNARLTPWELVVYGRGTFGSVAFDGMPALHSAVSNEAFRVGEYLLSCPGIEVDKRADRSQDSDIDDGERTPLMQVLTLLLGRGSTVRVRHLAEFATRLLKAGADPLLADRNGDCPFLTVLYYASRFQHPKGNQSGLDKPILLLLGQFMTGIAGRLPTEDVAEELKVDLEDMLVRAGDSVLSEKDRQWLQATTGLRLPLARPEELVLGWLQANRVCPTVLTPLLNAHCPDVMAALDAMAMDTHLPRAMSSPARLRL